MPSKGRKEGGRERGRRKGLGEAERDWGREGSRYKVKTSAFHPFQLYDTCRFCYNVNSDQWLWDWLGWDLQVCFSHRVTGEADATGPLSKETLNQEGSCHLAHYEHYFREDCVYFLGIFQEFGEKMGHRKSMSLRDPPICFFLFCDISPPPSPIFPRPGSWRSVEPGSARKNLKNPISALALGVYYVLLPWNCCIWCTW